MIVIINSVDLQIVSKITHDLAERYEAGALVDIHTIAAGRHSQTIKKVTQNIPLDNIRKIISSAKNCGKEHLVISYTFDTPEAIKRLRVFLSEYDNEIYAFRLRFSPAVLKVLVETLDQSSEAAFMAYSIWLERQETGVRYGDMGYELLVNSTDSTEMVNAIWDDIHAPVELIEYQELWPEMFAREREQILQALQGKILDVEHIGSTAIPGMPAKPIIDILIIIEDLQNAKFCIQPLRGLGYAFIDYPQNTDRLFFRKGTPRSHHIHIVERGGDSERDHLHFRDVLLSDDTLRNEYLQLKLDAMRQYKHRRALYGERKNELIKKALAKFRM
jgi:GrpB-like predicted nucleotidyltransferase (UPF0157 family)